jgi:hypothetical protein
MFKLSAAASYWWPVTIHIAVDGGKFEKHEFSAQYKRMKTSDTDALVDRLGETDEESGEQFKMIDLLVEIVTGWKGVADPDGNEIPFSTDALRSACNDFPALNGAFFDAWINSLAKGKEKNSGARRSTG